MKLALSRAEIYNIVRPRFAEMMMLCQYSAKLAGRDETIDKKMMEETIGVVRRPASHSHPALPPQAQRGAQRHHLVPQQLRQLRAARAMEEDCMQSFAAERTEYLSHCALVTVRLVMRWVLDHQSNGAVSDCQVACSSSSVRLC